MSHYILVGEDHQELMRVDKRLWEDWIGANADICRVRHDFCGKTELRTEFVGVVDDDHYAPWHTRVFKDGTERQSRREFSTTRQDAIRTHTSMLMNLM